MLQAHGGNENGLLERWAGFRMSRCSCSRPELQTASSDGLENIAQEGSAGQRAAVEPIIPADRYADYCLFWS